MQTRAGVSCSHAVQSVNLILFMMIYVFLLFRQQFFITASY